MKKNIVLISMIFGLAIVLLSGCSNTEASTIARSGDWNGTSDLGTILLTVNADGTAVTQAMVNYSCTSNGVALSESLTLSGDEKGWEIKNGKINIDFLDTSVQLKITGKFNSDNSKIAGKIVVRSCSGKWEATR